MVLAVSLFLLHFFFQTPHLVVPFKETSNDTFVGAKRVIGSVSLSVRRPTLACRRFSQMATGVLSGVNTAYNVTEL